PAVHKELGGKAAAALSRPPRGNHSEESRGLNQSLPRAERHPPLKSWPRLESEAAIDLDPRKRYGAYAEHGASNGGSFGGFDRRKESPAGLRGQFCLQPNRGRSLLQGAARLPQRCRNAIKSPQKDPA